MTIQFKYFVAGFLFGCFFPIGASVFMFTTSDLSFSYQNFIEIHKMNQLLYMIDSAPIFLGLFALIGGISKAKSINLLSEIKHISVELEKISSKLNKEGTDALSFYNNYSEQIQGKSANSIQSNTNNEKTVKNAQTNSVSLIDTSKEITRKLHGLIQIQTSKRNDNEKLFTEMIQFIDDIKSYQSLLSEIKTIASQINIMALNSSVEANKIGEQGKGFSQIAKSIRKLAENTAQVNSKLETITNVISQKIEYIHQNIANELVVIDNINQQTSTINKNLENTESLANQLNEILDNLAKGSNQQSTDLKSLEYDLKHLYNQFKTRLNTIVSYTRQESHIINSIINKNHTNP
ncbi:MAG: methyl-accepting chemotaxis protein [Bacteroidales bacterium]|nr:methyl-accepting chemotaxis protein [Bacteroidales bacterium]